MNKKFAILITTKNRLKDLKVTLLRLHHFIEHKDVEFIICDDGSNDGTFDYVSSTYPQIQLIKHQSSKGYLYNRNYMLNTTSATYAISLDDDANFLTETVLETIDAYFTKYANCGLIAFRIFWGIDEPRKDTYDEKEHRVNGFVGCGHVWRMDAWKDIPDYPVWFEFYGEEQFASFQLFKSGWQIRYLPEVFIHHRVDMKARQQHSDFLLRQRRSLSSGWYLYFLFYPKSLIFKHWASSVYSQLRLKVFKGDFKVLIALCQATGDVLINLPRLFKNSHRLTPKEYKEFIKLPQAKIYWQPKNEEA